MQPLEKTSQADVQRMDLWQVLVLPCAGPSGTWTAMAMVLVDHFNGDMYGSLMGECYMALGSIYHDIFWKLCWHGYRSTCHLCGLVLLG